MTFIFENALEEAVAITQIHKVLHRYAFLAREEAQWEKMVPLWTPNGVFRITDGPDWKPTEISKVVQGEEPEFIRHHVTTIDIDFVSGKEAHVETAFLAVTDLAPLDHWGCWKDVFHKQDNGRWLIAERTVETHGGNPDGWLAKTILRMAKQTSL